MALIACPECEGRVSDRAVACPHCGFPVRDEVHGPGGPEEILERVSPVMFGRNPLTHFMMIILSLLVIGLFLYLAEWLRCRATRLVITTERTILYSGILSRQTNEIRHSDIRNIQVHQSVFDRMVNTGKLDLSSSGQSTVEITVGGLPDPQGLADLIRKQR